MWGGLARAREHATLPGTAGFPNESVASDPYDKHGSSNANRLSTGHETAVGGLAYGGGGHHFVDDIETITGPEAANPDGRCVDNTYGEIAVVNNCDTAIAPG